MKQPSIERLRDLAGPVSRETFDRLVEFERLFQKWAGRINLAASSTLDDVWERHIVDSAQLVVLAVEAKRWVDLGSGGGYPGLIVAILLAERKGAHVNLIESNRKKASFLQFIVGQFGLPASVRACRIEQGFALTGPADVVTARALAPLHKLLTLASPWLQGGAKGLFHKGRDYESEVQESADLWSFDLLEHRSKTDPTGVILEIDALRRNRTEVSQAMSDTRP